MLAEVTKRRFTVDEYYRLAEVGILSAKDRVELIDGEIIEMTPIGNKHAARVNRANDVLTLRLRGRAMVSVQNSLMLNNYNAPQPDIVVAKPREDYYETDFLTPETTFFVMEISDSTIHFDMKVKLPLYARTSVAELWIENLQDELLLVCRDPSPSGYRTQITLRRGDAVAPLAFPDVIFKVDEFLG
jgi:Uma2 family endonuclease